MKNGSKNDRFLKNGTQNLPDARFLRFWSVLGGGVFSTILGTAKKHPTSGKIRHFRPKGGTGLVKWVGPAECAGLPER